EEQGDYVPCPCPRLERCLGEAIEQTLTRRIAMNRSTAKWIMSTFQCRHCCERVTHVENDFLCTPCHQLIQLFPNGESNRRRRGHTFLTTTMLKTIPALYATENIPCEVKTLYAHYFYGGHDWYIVEL